MVISQRPGWAKCHSLQGKLTYVDAFIDDDKHEVEPKDVDDPKHDVAAL